MCVGEHRAGDNTVDSALKVLSQHAGAAQPHSQPRFSSHNSNHPVGSLAHVQGGGALCSAGQRKVEGQAAARGVRVSSSVGGGGGQVQSLIRGRGWRGEDGIRNEIPRRPWG